MLHMPTISLDRAQLMSLVNKYEPDKKAFKIGDKLVPLMPSDVKDIVRLPIVGKEVKMDGNYNETLLN